MFVARLIALTRSRESILADHFPVHLVCGGEDDRGCGAVPSYALEHVERALRVHGKILERVLEACGHRDLACKVEHGFGIAQLAPEGAPVAHVARDHSDPVAPALLQPTRVLLRPAACEA